MIFDYDDVSPKYVAIQGQIVDILKSTSQAMTMRQLKAELGTDEFLGDALEILIFAGIVAVEGSILVPRYRYLGEKKVATETKTCPTCQQTKPLIEFYQEWAGAPSKLCKSCKVNRQKTYRRKKT